MARPEFAIIALHPFHFLNQLIEEITATIFQYFLKLNYQWGITYNNYNKV